MEDVFGRPRTPWRARISRFLPAWTPTALRARILRQGVDNLRSRSEPPKFRGGRSSNHEWIMK